MFRRVSVHHQESGTVHTAMGIISYIMSYHLFSFRRSVQDSKINGYGNSHIFRKQEMKAAQQCTTVMWSGAVLGFRRLETI